MLLKGRLLPWTLLAGLITLGHCAVVIQSRDGGLLDVVSFSRYIVLLPVTATAHLHVISFIYQDTDSYSGSDGTGVGGGASGSLQVCLLSDLVCLGDAGAIVVGALGAEAVSEGKGVSEAGKEGSVAVAKSHGLFGLGAAEAANLCLANNCLGGGGALVIGNATAGAIGGAIPAASSSSSSSSSAAATSSISSSSSASQKQIRAAGGITQQQQQQEPPLFLFDLRDATTSKTRLRPAGRRGPSRLDEDS